MKHLITIVVVAALVSTSISYIRYKAEIEAIDKEFNERQVILKEKQKEGMKLLCVSYFRWKELTHNTVAGIDERCITAMQ